MLRVSILSENVLVFIKTINKYNLYDFLNPDERAILGAWTHLSHGTCYEVDIKQLCFSKIH